MSFLIETEKLKKYYPVLGGVFKRRVADVKAVDEVNLTIGKGECFGLVGESGCGKTTFGKTVIRLVKPTSGHIYFDVQRDRLEEIRKLEHSKQGLSQLRKMRSKYDLAVMKGKNLKTMRRKMQIVFQDPSTSLDPRMLVKDIIAEPLVVQKLARGADVRKGVLEMLEKVGLGEMHLYRYPHEFSGGQRQRVAIARALIVNPEFVVLDEPTSSVDVSVRAHLLDLFQKLRKEMGLTYVFISHDLGVVECISDRVAVMYLGKVVELATTNELFSNALHPYTQALMSAIPVPDPTAKMNRIILTGDVPSPVNPPAGCRFHPRCAKATDRCRKEKPELVHIGNGHFIACHLFTH